MAHRWSGKAGGWNRQWETPMERDLAAEIDSLKADLALMQRVLDEAKETSEAAFAQSALAATHVANALQRLSNLTATVKISAG